MHMDGKNDSRINWDKTAVLSWSGELPSASGRVSLRISVIGYTRNELGLFTEDMEKIAEHERQAQVDAERKERRDKLKSQQRSSQKFWRSNEVKRMQCTTGNKNLLHARSTNGAQPEPQTLIRNKGKAQLRVRDRKKISQSRNQGPTQVSSKQARTHHIL